MTLRYSVVPRAPMDCAARTQISLTVLAPVHVLMTTGGNVAQVTRAMTAVSPSLNHSRNSGTQARPGIGFRTLTMGTQKLSITRERAMSRPSGTPKTAATAKPASSRYMVEMRCCCMMPRLIKRPAVASTWLTGGNSTSGKIPVRATASQMSPITSSGNRVLSSPSAKRPIVRPLLFPRSWIPIAGAEIVALMACPLWPRDQAFSLALSHRS
jgi:hypothetical protein